MKNDKWKIGVLMTGAYFPEPCLPEQEEEL
jgi:hypothetical protein